MNTPQHNSPLSAKQQDMLADYKVPKRNRCRVRLTAEQASTVQRLLVRPNLLGAAIQVGKHGFIELDVEATDSASQPYGAIVEIAPGGSWSVAAGRLPESHAVSSGRKPWTR